MTHLAYGLCLAALTTGLAGCNMSTPEHADGDHHGHDQAMPEHARGAHGGRLLSDGDLTIELTIFESGVAPEFRVWASHAGLPLAPEAVDLDITLTRLGEVKERIGFSPQDDFLRGDTIVYEPHSFVVSVTATYAGKRYIWDYDNFEGRTRIDPDMAQAFGLETELAGPATIEDNITVYGRVVPNAEAVRSISARFDGLVRSMAVSVGDVVTAGQALATVESDESLKPYTIAAPISGVVATRVANPGEQTAGRQLLTIVDTSTVWVELAIFPSDRTRVQAGTSVLVNTADGTAQHRGVIDRLNTATESNQAVLARVVLDSAEGALVPGMHVTAKVQVATYPVPLAVKNSGLQSFRDFTVVYAQIGHDYEVRMLDLGRRDEQWTEVLGGLQPGTRYVTTHSYLVKADIEKSSASHDH